MVNEMNTAIISTPVGLLEITEDNNAIIKLSYIYEENIKKEINSYYLNKSIAQINEYFEGKRTSFDLKLNPEGTDFQIDVWKEVQKIPYGKTKTYLEIAKAIGDPGAARAVGNANNKNPIPILIPCHRVVEANGNLTGYAGGIKRKDWLLHHELKHSKSEMQLYLF